MASEHTKKLEIVATVSSIVSFTWIAMKDFALVFMNGAFTWCNTIRLAPYIVFVVSMFILVGRRKIHVEYHRLLSIVATDGTGAQPIPVEGREHIELYSLSPHFKLTLSGTFFGPELNKIKRYFGKSETRVYSLVCEDSRPHSRTLFWLQKNEYGILDVVGGYRVVAYLGGSAHEDAAQDKEVFAVYIMIPRDKKYQFDEHAVYERDKIPKAIYLSEKPLYVTTRRTR